MPDREGRFHESPPCPDWKGQARWAFAFGFIMLLVGALSLVAAFLYFQSNAVLLTARNADKEPLTFEARFTGIAVLAGTFILLCLTQAVLSFSRGRDLQDRLTRWQLLAYLLDELTPEDLLRLVEQGPPQAAKKTKPRQLRFPWNLLRPSKDNAQEGTVH
jgi:hypothetical protein